MSRVNQVKKVLRDRGVEMDVDDVLQALRANPHYRTGLSRNQVAGSLADLHSTDPDIIRTRRGLYRYVDACQASIVPPPGRGAVDAATVAAYAGRGARAGPIAGYRAGPPAGTRDRAAR